MKQHAQVVIIGGGALGTGLLYFLTKEGWRDVVLVEKGELTSGSTWHAAGLVQHFIGGLSMAKPKPVKRLAGTGAAQFALLCETKRWTGFTLSRAFWITSTSNHF